MTFTYIHQLDGFHNLHRIFGFQGKDDAGEAKLEVGINLLERILHAPNLRGLSVDKIDASSSAASRWFREVWGEEYPPVIQAYFKDGTLKVVLDARHYWRTQRDSTASYLDVLVMPNSSAEPAFRLDYCAQLMGREFAQGIKEYLDKYQFNSQPRGVVVAQNVLVPS